MSFLSENARYKLVMFDKDKNILNNPYYSLPADDIKSKGKQSLVRRIIKHSQADKHKYAYIYDNITGKIIEVYINGILQGKTNHTEQKTYGKNISALKMWFVTKDKPVLPVTRYSDIRNDAVSEQTAYWGLINDFVKSIENRNIIKYAEIYRISDNQMIGRYIRENGKLKGIGIYHRK